MNGLLRVSRLSWPIFFASKIRIAQRILTSWLVTYARYLARNCDSWKRGRLRVIWHWNDSKNHNSKTISYNPKQWPFNYVFKPIVVHEAKQTPSNLFESGFLFTGSWQSWHLIPWEWLFSKMRWILQHSRRRKWNGVFFHLKRRLCDSKRKFICWLVNSTRFKFHSFF